MDLMPSLVVRPRAKSENTLSWQQALFDGRATVRQRLWPSANKWPHVVTHS